MADRNKTRFGSQSMCIKVDLGIKVKRHALEAKLWKTFTLWTAEQLARSQSRR
jgi:hypothetical protein